MAVADATYATPTSLTVREYVERTWLPQAEDKFRPTTLAAYRSNLANHVLPRLGSTQLRQLTPTTLNALYVELRTSGRVVRTGRKRGASTPVERRGGLSSQSVAHVHRLLHRVLADAVRQRLIVRNPAADAEPPTPQRTQMNAWTPEQLRAFIEAESEDRLAALWRLVATTGLRRGELVGLRWVDLDLDGARLSVTSTITAAGYKLVTGPPKTEKGRRVVPLAGSTVAALRRHRTRQAEERLAAGEAWIDSGLVFCREDGSPLHPQTVTYLFGRRAASAGLPTIRLHDVRHSYATAALAGGVHPKVVQEILGHSSIAVTLDTYSHVSEGVARESTDRIAALILGS